MKVEKLEPRAGSAEVRRPNGMALRMLAFHGNQWPLNFERFGFFAPAHYLKQFHPKYNASITDYKVFNEKADDLNPERPAMTSWRVTSWKPGDRAIIADAQSVLLEGRSAGQSAAVHRRAAPRAGREQRSAQPQGDQRRDRHAVPQHRHRQVLAAPGEQAARRLSRLALA